MADIPLAKSPLPLDQLAGVATATSGQAPLADGDGGAVWGTPAGGGGGGGSTATAKATRQSTTQSIGNGSLVAISHDTEVWDTDGMFSTGTNPTRITVKTAGKFRITAGCIFFENATGGRALVIRKNGTDRIAESFAPSASGSGAHNGQRTVAVEDDAEVDDYYEAMVFQTSGVSLNILAEQRNFLSVSRFAD